MKSNKLLMVLMLLGVVSALFVGAVTLYDVKFSTGNAHEQITTTAKANYTLYIDVPRAYISNLSIEIVGVAAS